MKKRLVSLLVMVAMLATLAAGCNKQAGQETGGSETGNNGADNTATVTQAPETTDTVDTPAFPLKETVTYTMAAFVNGGSGASAYQERQYIRRILQEY